MITIKMIKGSERYCEEVLRFKDGEKTRRKRCHGIARYLINYHGQKLYVCKRHKCCYDNLKLIEQRNKGRYA